MEGELADQRNIRSLGEPIARGRTAEIYAWDDGRVLKLCYDWVSEDAVRYEARIAGAVHAAGLPVPAVGKVQELAGRFGLVYEHVKGQSMFKALAAKPWHLRHHAGSLAALHAQTHEVTSVEGVPSQRQRLHDKIRHAEGLEPDLKQAGLAVLAGMPEGHTLCHGDFHPENVLITDRGPIIIDWIDATLGNPLADVARTSVILLGVRHSPGVSGIEGLMLAWYHQAYIQRYFRLRPGGEAEYERWLPIVAAARMSEGITEVAGWLRRQVVAGLT